jgi:hypothetical protein
MAPGRMGYRDAEAPRAFTGVSVPESTQDVVERLTWAYRPLSWQIQDASTHCWHHDSRAIWSSYLRPQQLHGTAAALFRNAGVPPLPTSNGDVFRCTYRLTDLRSNRVSV